MGIFVVWLRMCILCREVESVRLIGMLERKWGNKLGFVVCVFEDWIWWRNVLSGMIV